MIKMKSNIFVKVLTPWGTETTYMLPRDLQQAFKHDRKQGFRNENMLIGGLINVPILEFSFQKKYHKLVIPCFVEDQFEIHFSSKWRTRSQFVTNENLNFNVESLVNYFKHDYNKLNKRVINQVLKFWNSVLNP